MLLKNNSKTAARPQRNCKSLMNCPFITINALRQGEETHPNAISPFSQCEGYPVMGQVMIMARIVLLFTACAPFTITRLVVPVVVNPVKRMLRRWTVAHVFIKMLKFTPSVAHRDSSDVVIPQRVSLRITASGQHVGPCSILRCPRFPVSLFPSNHRFWLAYFIIITCFSVA